MPTKNRIFNNKTMSTTQAIIGIALPIVTYFIGRYYKSISKTSFNNLEKARDYWQEQHRVALKARNEAYDIVANLKKLIKDNETKIAERERIASKALMELDTLKRNTTQVLIVPNIDPHHAADTEYVGIYPSPESGLPPAHLTREAYQFGVDRLKDNPEDNILTKTHNQ
jgi:hypothetical protein